MADNAPLWQQAPPVQAPQAPAQPQPQPAPQPQWLSAPAVGTLAAAPQQGPGALEAIEDPNKLAGVVAQGVASLPTDPDAKAKYLAKSLGIPLDRVGFKGGRVVYLADDGKTYYAEPSFSPIDNPKRTLIEAPQLAASAFGPSLSAAGSIAGGALTPEFGAGIPGAAAGGAAGDAARQGLAAWLTKETLPPMDRALSIAENAALGGVGEGAGKALFKGAQVYANRGNPLKVSGYDLARATPPRINAAEANMKLAQNAGVTVTPGEATNMRSLLNRQRQLGRQEEGATPLADFYLKRNTEQLPSAFDKMVLSRISPQSAPALGARDLQQGAGDTIKAAVNARRVASKPGYDAVMRPDNVLPPADFNHLMANNPIAANALKAVRADPELSTSIEGMPDSSLPVLDLVKRHMDAMWKGFKADPKGGNHARIVGGARDEFLTALDGAFPGYDTARAAFEGASPAVTELKNGLVGLAAKDRASGLQNVPTTMFGVASADPISIASARAGFQKAGKMAEWNAGVRSYLDGLFQSAAKQAQGPAANFWKTIKGDSRQYANLKAALDPTHLDALDQFMKIAEMVKRAPAEGAQTATDIGGRSAFAGKMSKIAGYVANPLKIPAGVQNWLADQSAGKNVAQLVDLITSPNSIRELRRLKMLSPGSQKWTAGITNLMTQGGAGEIPSPSPDQPLGYLLQRPATP